MAGADAHDGPHRRTQRGAETRAAMVLVAERLFAEQGINAVSLREVGRAANQKNRSVTQYYFGSREAMIDAVLEHRLGPINRERASMVRAVELSGRSRDLRSLLEALVVPAVETLGSSGYWFR